MEREPSRASIVWSLFTKKDRFSATCNACHNDYSYKTSISNLKKHWKQKHGDIVEAMIRDSNSDNSDGEHEDSLLKGNSNPTWKYYEVLDSDKFEANCKLCGENIPYETVSDLTKHVRDHGEQAKDTDDDDDDNMDDDTEVQEVKSRKKNSKLWQYFSIIDDKTKLASCIFCKRILSYAGTISNLKKHLVRKHPQVKKMVVSANGKIYEVESGAQLIEEDEKDPIEMDTVYLEEIDDTMDQIRTQQIAIKSPKKKEKQPLKRHFAQIAKEPVINSSANFHDESLPKQNKPNTMDTLDYFGQYVISLLKEMPKLAAEQLQNEIIMQIFAKKAAVMPQTSNKYTITVSDNIRDCDQSEMEPVTTVTIRESHEVAEHADTEIMIPGDMVNNNT